MIASMNRVTIPDVSITENVLRHAERLGDKPALIDGPTGRVVTYRQLSHHVRRAACGLARQGFGKGDVFAICSPNVSDYAVAFLAVASLGGVTTTIDPGYTVEEIADQLTDSGARLLVTVWSLMDKAQEAARRSGVEGLFVFGRAEGAASFTELLERGDQPPATRIEPGRDVVALPYSSGTTGQPKGVMLTHRNLVASLCQSEGMAHFDGVGEDDVVMALLPFFHIDGLSSMIGSLASGSTAVTMPRFDLEECLALVQKRRVTVLPLVPPMVLGLVKHLAAPRFDLSSVRLVMSAAAPLGADIVRLLSARLRCPVIQGYGMTEAGGATHLCPTRSGPPKPGSVGLTVPNTEVKIVRVDGDLEVPAGQPGELWVRGPQIMKGYLHRPEDTAACLDHAGWLHTGDVAYVDDEGYLFIVATKMPNFWKTLPPMLTPWWQLTHPYDLNS